jgi:hypothetical protein
MMWFRYYMNSMMYDWWSLRKRCERCEQADTYLCKIATANDPSDSEKLTTQTPAGKDTMTEIFGERGKKITSTTKEAIPINMIN